MKGWKPHSSKKVQYRIQWEMKKMDTQFLTPKNKDKCYKRVQWQPQKSLKEEILEGIDRNLCRRY
jgi:hypothetical protein